MNLAPEVEKGRSHLEGDHAPADQHDGVGDGLHLENILVGEDALGPETLDRDLDRFRTGAHDHVLGADLKVPIGPAHTDDVRAVL